LLIRLDKLLPDAFRDFFTVLFESTGEKSGSKSEESVERCEKVAELSEPEFDSAGPNGTIESG
jgi:hypothetical protein